MRIARACLSLVIALVALQVSTGSAGASGNEASQPGTFSFEEARGDQVGAEKSASLPQICKTLQRAINAHDDYAELRARRTIEKDGVTCPRTASSEAMPLAWKDVIQNREFQGLSTDQKVAAQKQYFAEVVAPRLPQKQQMAAWDQFTQEYPLANEIGPADAASSTLKAGQSGGGNYFDKYDPPHEVGAGEAAADLKDPTWSDLRDPNYQVGAGEAAVRAVDAGANGGNVVFDVSSGSQHSNLFVDALRGPVGAALLGILISWIAALCGTVRRDAHGAIESWRETVKGLIGIVSTKRAERSAAFLLTLYVFLALYIAVVVVGTPSLLPEYEAWGAGVLWLNLMAVICYAGRALGDVVLFRNRRLRNSANTLDGDTFDERQAYCMIDREIESNKMDRGLWLKAFAQGGGIEGQQKLRYVELRMDELRAEHAELVKSRARAAAAEHDRIAKATATTAQLKARFLDGYTLEPRDITALAEAARVKRELLVMADRSRGKTLLHLAADAGMTDTVKLLLALGASPDAVDGNGRRPYLDQSEQG